jgi:hypothetical protein
MRIAISVFWVKPAFHRWDLHPQDAGEPFVISRMLIQPVVREDCAKGFGCSLLLKVPFSQNSNSLHEREFAHRSPKPIQKQRSRIGIAHQIFAMQAEILLQQQNQPARKKSVHFLSVRRLGGGEPELPEVLRALCRNSAIAQGGMPVASRCGAGTLNMLGSAPSTLASRMQRGYHGKVVIQRINNSSWIRQANSSAEGLFRACLSEPICSSMDVRRS